LDRHHKANILESLKLWDIRLIIVPIPIWSGNVSRSSVWGQVICGTAFLGVSLTRAARCSVVGRASVGFFSQRDVRISNSFLMPGISTSAALEAIECETYAVSEFSLIFVPFLTFILSLCCCVGVS